MYRATLVVCLTCVLVSPSTATEPVSLDTLLQEMIDRDQVAQVPEPRYTCRQASSYDRDTIAPDKPGWFANMDRSQFVRTEQNGARTEYVMMDEAGPGAVVRFWATWNGARGKEFTNGTLRFYLDGDAEPAIEGPIEQILDRGGLVGPPLSEGVSSDTIYAHRGHNLYLPIPYASHCKITYETSAPVDRGAHQGEALYYQINYRTYEPGTPVRSFSQKALSAADRRLAAVQARLRERHSREASSVEAKGEIQPGKARSIAFEGPAAVRHLTIKLNSDNLPQALRSTVLDITFDGDRSVWCPVGSFFGTGYQIHAYRSWYTEVTDEGVMHAFWVMPFAESCTLNLVNFGNRPVRVEDFTVQIKPWTWNERSLHFHATWHQLTETQTFRGGESPGAGAYDVNYVTINGRGTYVGDTLEVFNGAQAWWGEGDEKIYVDGEDFPSHVGTGTEDYYGYAWCKPAYFCSPFHAQPTGAGNLQPGYSVNSRYRSLDAIPFEHRLQFDMELWHWADTKVNFAPSTFWYARPDARANIQPEQKTVALPVALKRSDIIEVFRVEGALEGESLNVVSKSGGTLEQQQVGHFHWSNETQLWWRDGKTGDRLVLEFPVSKAGRYAVTANLTKANDYGIVRLRINDQSAVEFDRFHDRVANDVVSLGEYDLKTGPNRLSIEIAGAHPQAIKRYMFGLDYLQLQSK